MEPCVRVCPRQYDNNMKASAFSGWPFELDHFQKYSVEATLSGHHVLVTAATGSGKTLAAEHAIQYFCLEKQLKTIYTAPIKSLSNQKFFEFTEKYPDISFGILTGDIKFNPEADCVIMTTEILRNALSSSNREEKEETKTDFQLDVSKVGCVIFDEVHYINDRDRGMVWEESIISLPQHIQLVMLSATIDRAERFAQWVAETTQRNVWLCSTDIRVVPLTHYSYWLLPQSSVKQLVGSPVESLVAGINESFVTLKKAHGKFQQSAVNNLHKVTREVEKRHITLPRRKFVFNQLARKLKEAEMLPGICFVFSRKRVMEHAAEMEVNLFDDIGEEKKPVLVQKECEHILRRKLSNYAEYLMLPEYQELLKLLQKGVAVHHSGMLPILKEMVEMLFSRGYIKMLFATETFAVGVNMPTKTVVFSSLEKYDGKGFRPLLSHEYTQMAGRAGRRGLDTVGHVIHLNNLFDTPYTQDYERMLDGTPQSLVSKFDITFDFVLRAMQNTTDVANRSMMSIEIERELQYIQRDIDALERALLDENTEGSVEDEALREYQSLQSDLEFVKNKKRKRIIQQIKQLEETHPGVKQHHQASIERAEQQAELQSKRDEYTRATQYVERTDGIVRDALQHCGFIDDRGELSAKGILAARIREVAPLPFAEVMFDDVLTDLEPPTLAAVLSCFTAIRVGDETQEHQPTVAVREMKDLSRQYDRYYDLELQCRNYADEDAYTLHYDLQEPVLAWCNASSENEAKQVVQDIILRGIFLGEFVKALLKINAIAAELQQVCEQQQPPNLRLKQSLAAIPELTLKYVASNESLYI